MWKPPTFLHQYAIDPIAAAYTEIQNGAEMNTNQENFRRKAVHIINSKSIIFEVSLHRRFENLYKMAERFTYGFTIKG